MSEMSLARELELYDGWLTMRDVPKVVPPDDLEMAPKTTIVLAVDLPIVQ
jgi:hypothetical protein